MNLLAKKKKRIFYLVFAGAGFVILFCYFIFHDNEVNHIPFEAYAIERIDPNRIAPVDEETLAFNPSRKKAGLIQIRKDWKIAQTYHFIMDGPEVSVVLDKKNIPVKIISIGQGWIPPDLKYYTFREYDIIDNKFNGRAATWKGKPEKLFLVQTFQNNVLNGPTIYYSEDGEEICQCIFLNGKPWTGRTLERGNFNLVGWDISYKDGEKDGMEKYFKDGKLGSLSTFKRGSPEGLQQQYHKGQLRGERIIENGILRLFRSWHQNGQLQEKTRYDHKGKFDGVRRMWDESGELEIEEHYRHGKDHGRRWWKGHKGEVWFWKGEVVGHGNSGKTEFDRREK